MAQDRLKHWYLQSTWPKRFCHHTKHHETYFAAVSNDSCQLLPSSSLLVECPSWCQCTLS